MVITNRRFVSLLFVGLICLTNVSCGGSRNAESRSTGRVVLNISWPATREIPAATRSINVVAKVLEPLNGPQVGQVVVQRPAGGTSSQAVLMNIPSVKVRLTATAHASTDGSGAVLASGSAEVQVTESGTTGASIILAPITGTAIVLGNVTNGEFQGPCGHFSVYARFEDTNDPATVTWTQSRGTFLVEGPDSMRFLVPYGDGPVTITARLVADPTISASATVIVDELVGIFNTDSMGQLRITNRLEGSDTHSWSAGRVLVHTGNSFTSTWAEGGITYTFSGTVSGDSLVGTVTASGPGAGDPFAVNGTRSCPDFP